MTLTAPGYNKRLDCQALAAKISERQCVINQFEAQARAQIGFGTLEVDRLYPCLACGRGREIKAQHPEVEGQFLSSKERGCEEGVMIPTKQFYRPDEVAEILVLSSRTVYRMIRDGRLPAIKWGQGPWRIPREFLEPFLMKGAGCELE